MLSVHPRYITDYSGKKISVVLPMEEFKNLMEHLEDLEDISLYDEAKKLNEPSVPIDEAFQLMEQMRKPK
ncbi:MAG: hypothetical protein H7257_10520 [Taibaiella sp.]|nr:hypothetical protein [Taibaiella sp.]